MDRDLPTKTLAETVFFRLRDDILQCRLQPSDRLRLDVLRASYGVGMSPLREALMRLTSMGLVTVEGQRGFTVAAISVEDLLGITKSRVWIETMALRFAMATGDRNWEAEILAAEHRLSGYPVYTMENGTPMFNEAWQAPHRAFHAALVSVATSPHILRFREHLYDLSDRYRRLSGRIANSPRDIVAEHKALAAATLRRDLPLATELMTEHLIGTTRLILSNDPEHGHQTDRLIARLMDQIRAGLAG